MNLIYLFLLGVFFISIFSIQAQKLKPIVSKAGHFDISEPLIQKASSIHNEAVNKWKDGLVKNYLGYKEVVNFDAKGTDPSTVQTINVKGIATPLLDFAGMDNISGYAPLDTDGDVGPNHYVQMVNSKFQVFDKSGTSF